MYMYVVTWTWLGPPHRTVFIKSSPSYKYIVERQRLPQIVRVLFLYENIVDPPERGWVSLLPTHHPPERGWAVHSYSFQKDTISRKKEYLFERCK